MVWQTHEITWHEEIRIACLLSRGTFHSPTSPALTLAKFSPSTFWMIRGRGVSWLLIGRRFAAALLPRLFGTNPRSHHKGATGRVRTGNQRLPVLCHCQLGQDIPDTETERNSWWKKLLLRLVPTKVYLLTNWPCEQLEERHIVCASSTVDTYIAGYLGLQESRLLKMANKYAKYA